MPPSAPKIGSIARSRDESSPCASSCLSSIPIRKKKITISPSLTQCSSESRASIPAS